MAFTGGKPMQEHPSKPPAPVRALKPYKGSIHISLTEIEIQDASQMTSNAPLRRRLVGQAQLDANESITRAGDDHSASRALAIGISPITADQAHLTSAETQKKAAATKSNSPGDTPASDEPFNPSSPGFKLLPLNTHGNATMGYIEPDWELDVQGHWYVELELIDDTFNCISELVEQGKLRRLALSLDLANLLVEHSHSSSESRHAKLYLAPEGYRENLDPRLLGSKKGRWMRSDGWITGIQVRSFTTSLKSRLNAIDAQDDGPVAHGTQPIDESVPTKVVSAIDGLKITVIWVGALISLVIYMSS
jgi:hypothetical protein